MTDQIVDAVADAFESESKSLDHEQAIYGLDALDEKRLHLLIHHGLLLGGYGVWPEQPYPTETKKPRNEARRCDLVLTATEQEPLEDPRTAETLFTQDRAVPPEAAYWMEIKCAAQHTIEGPNRRYATELSQPITTDVAKLASDPMIFHAGVLLILFTRDRTGAQHDLGHWHRLALDKGYPVASPSLRGIDMVERSGHGHLAIALFPVRRL